MRLLKSGGGVVAIALMVLVPATALAQSSSTTGQIYGTARDPNGGVMPGVGVEAKNLDTGFARSAVTDTSGYYRLDLLPSGTYDVRSTLDGFKSEIKRGVVVTLGSTVQVNIDLQIASVAEEIVVTAESPIVESTNPSITSAVSEREIANLPLQGRDFTDFVVLTPGAVAGSTDEIAGGRGGINIGARAIQNSFNIDGANSQSSFFGEERGGTRPPFTFSQAAIKEFQVLRSSYNLQFQATGGVINAITKSGTNEFHGQVFGYYTDDSLTTEDALDRKEESEQKQYGFALGGPIVRDKLHFFTSIDAQDFQIPKFTSWDVFDGREDDFTAKTGLDYDTESSNYPSTNDALVMLLKFDWQLGVNNLLSARYNYSDQEGINQTSTYEDTGLSNNGLEGNSFSSLVFTLNSVLSDRAFNEVFGQYAFEERPRAANNSELPETQIRWYEATFGQNQFLPNFLDETRYQLVDNFTYYAGDHTIKAGINFDLVNFDDGFCRYCSGQFQFWSADDFLDGATAASFTQAFSDYDGTVEYDTNYYAFYLQDDWRVSPNFTLNYGLRYDLQDNPTPYETNPLWPNTGQIPTDSDNWSARVGFAWDIRGDGKQVLRGGLGRFYDNTPTLLLANAMLANGVRVIRVSGNCGSDIICPEWPNIYENLGDLPLVRSDIFVFNPDFQNPETNRISLGYEAEVVRDLSLGVDVIYYETEKLQRKQDQNLEDNGGTTIDGRPTYDRFTNVEGLGKIMEFNSDARAEYTAVMLTARKRFSNKWFLDASYTWSDAKDNDSNERSVSSSSDYADDQYNLDADWGPSNFDSTHKLVASFAWQLPANFMVSAIGTYRTGFPYSALDDRDLNTDGYVNNERAVLETSPGVYYHVPRNDYRQDDFKTLDLRLTWTARLGGSLELELIGEVFNAANWDNWVTTETDLVNSDGSLDEDFGVRDIPGTPRRYQVGAKFRF